MEFDALWLWSIDCLPPLSPLLFWSAFWDWLLDWVEEFQLPAFADALEPLDCWVLPSFSTATFGETLAEAACACAVWSMEFDALCDWSADCEPRSSLEVSHPQPVLPSEPVWPAFWDWLLDWVEEFQLPAL